MDRCRRCGFWDVYYEACGCPSMDKWYACPIEAEKEKKVTKEGAKQIADFVRSYIHEIITESGTDKNAHTNEVLRKVADRIEAMDTEPKKMGHWIREERHDTGQDQEFDYVVHFCSECGAQKRIGWMGVKYCPECGAKMSENPTGSNCTTCIIDGTDACSRGAGRAVDGRVCENFVGESED